MRGENIRSARVVIPLVIVLFALAALGSRACSSQEIRVTQEEAVAIAYAEAGFEVERHRVRFIRQGVREQPAWVVGVAGEGINKTFLVDARTGATTLEDQTLEP